MRAAYWIMPLLGALSLTLVSPAAAQSVAPVTRTDPETGVRYVVEQFMPANFPVSLVFAPDGRLFYTEKTTGSVRVVLPDGTLLPEPVVTLPTNALQERGMLGIALDPAFEDNATLYVVHTAEGTARDWPANALVRLRLVDNRAVEVEELMRVPITNGSLLHNGGQIHFDASGDLYWTIGDYGDAANAQDTETLMGAIHRFQVTDEGLLPASGNPYGNSIYALGLRNPYDFTFDPVSGDLFLTEIGPSCDDEINIIYPGFNYGWGSDYECVGLELIMGLDHGLYVPPLLSFTPVEAPTGLMFYEHEAIPAWQHDLFFCNWIYGDLRRAALNDQRTQVEAVYDIDLGDVQCRLDLVAGPDGALYFGTVGEFGGAIMRLRPVVDEGGS